MYKDKIGIINHYEASIEWVESLRKLPEEKWRIQIDKGKWTIVEVIGHLIPWDEFVLKQRIPYLLKATQLSPSPDAEIINQKAAKESRNRSKDETIELFVVIRKSLIEALHDVPDELWTRENIFNRKNKISLNNYFLGLIEHDNHHFRQIKRVL